MLTERFDRALQYASSLHRTQLRKGTTVPYVAHLLSVCALVLEAGGDEDQAIAALLHDGPEDCGGVTVLNEIRERFGNRVAEAVDSCSEILSDNLSEKRPWRERKEAYLEHLREASDDALLIATADKLYNVEAMVHGCHESGERMWQRFNAPKPQQLWFYGSFVRIVGDTGRAPKPLFHRLTEAVNQLRDC